MSTDPFQVDPARPSIRRADLPPGPPETPLIGKALRIRNDFVGLVREAAAYGDVSTVSVKPILICLVNHPELIREFLVINHRKTAKGAAIRETLRWMWGDGLLASIGAFHRKQRRLMQPRFHRRYIERYAEAMTEMASRKSRQWRDGAMVDMEQEMRDLTLRIVAKTLFDIETSDVVQRVGEAFTESDAYIYLRLTQPVFLRRLFHNLPLPSTRRFKAARAYVDELIYRLIEERRRSGAEGEDLLCLLMQARYENAESGEDARMSDELVRDEAVSLYIAGHDTTATTLTYALYLVSRHPEVEERFHAELDDVLGDRDATLDDLPRLPFTERIIRETLRLYPPVWGFSRTVFEPIELDGYRIPPGVLVMVSALVTQRDPRWFDDPLEFRPDRWTPEFGGALPRFAYFPFGGGQHQCIGEGFAWMEAKIALATGRRPQRRSSCQADRPAPLRSAGHPAWPGNPQCTNIRTGPVDRGRSVPVLSVWESPSDYRICIVQECSNELISCIFQSWLSVVGQSTEAEPA